MDIGKLLLDLMWQVRVCVRPRAVPMVLIIQSRSGGRLVRRAVPVVERMEEVAAGRPR